MIKKITIKKSDAISYFGSVSEISKKLGINSQAVSQWKDDVPEVSAWPLYYLSKGKIKASVFLEGGSE